VIVYIFAVVGINNVKTVIVFSTSVSCQQKTLNHCRTLFPVPVRQQLGKEMYHLADIDPTTRPFQLTVEEFGRLCHAYCTICDRDPRLYKYSHRAAREQREIFDDLYEEEQDGMESVPQKSM
jgi:hypothetical protein